MSEYERFSLAIRLLALFVLFVDNLDQQVKQLRENHTKLLTNVRSISLLEEYSNFFEKDEENARDVSPPQTL